MTFSIIICFYNASHKLIPTLRHIKNLDVSSITDCELILVNNNSHDDSCAIIQNEMNEFTLFPWKLVDEPKPGLSNARQKGIAESQFEYLLFCDDDNWLASDYMQTALPILESHKNIAVLGGYGEAISDIPIPHWFEQHKNFYAVGEQFPTNGKVYGVRNMVYGAGMIVRRSAWNYLISKGFTFFALGRTGKSLSSGEDSEMCLAFQIAGYDIWYNNTLRFKHYIEPQRLTDEYFKKLRKGMSSSGYVIQFYRRYLFGYKPKITKYFWIKELAYVCKDILKGLFVNSSREAFNRNLRFSKYLLQERGNYSKNVRNVLAICEELSSPQINFSPQITQIHTD